MVTMSERGTKTDLCYTSIHNLSRYVHGFNAQIHVYHPGSPSVYNTSGICQTSYTCILVIVSADESYQGITSWSNSTSFWCHVHGYLLYLSPQLDSLFLGEVTLGGGGGGGGGNERGRFIRHR